jgi:multidrug efflux pump subunit AcrA (membrane-fusion protein)
MVKDMPVRARIDNREDRLRTGMSFTIRLPLAGERFPSVPSVAVQWDRTGSYVWRVDGDKAERVQVRVLKREDEWVLVDAPLARDDLIVVEGVQRLRPGRLVQVKPREAIGEVAGRV